jgi:hypothetical protein
VFLQGVEAVHLTTDQQAQEVQKSNGPHIPGQPHKAPQARKQLSQDDEMSELIAALAAATATDRSYGSVGLVEYVRKHMYM